jgi:hypothetical protein
MLFYTASTIVKQGVEVKTKMVAYLGTRVSKDIRSAFVKKARKTEGMDQSDVLRELIHAFVEDRLSITPAQPKELIK